MSGESPSSANPYAAPQAESIIFEEPRGPEGIGGWLILPLIGLLFTPLAALATLFTHNIPPFTEGHFSTLTNPAFENYHPLWGVVLVFEPIGTVVVGTMAVWAIVLMFRKVRGFPRFMIALYVTNIVIVFIDTVLCYQLPVLAEESAPAMLGQLVRNLIAAAVWIPYMLISKRVRNTFVH